MCYVLKTILKTQFSFFTGDKMRQRRRRTAFTDKQLDLLEKTFENEKFPGIQIREDLAREMNIREDRIQVELQSLIVNSSFLLLAISRY